MVQINMAGREIVLKLVYYGPALSGKTTNLQKLHELLDPAARRAAADCIVAAVGATTAAALREHGIEPDVVPKRPEPRELVRALVEHVVLLRSDSGGREEGGAEQGGGDR